MLNDICLGVNYEGGKIIEYAKSYDSCVCSINLQIAMDAPFFGDVAHESVRSKGPSETQFKGYNEKYMLNQIKIGLDEITQCCKDKNANILVIQIARGRSAKQFVTKIKPLIGNISTEIICGYHSIEYFKRKDKKLFGFINIGMFARLNKDIRPGEVFIPIHSWDVEQKSTNNKLFVSKHRNHNVITKLPPMYILGVLESMPFVTPNDYNLSELLSLFTM